MKYLSKLSKEELIVELTFLNRAYEVVVESNKELEKQLLIQRVSQQRELLIAFAKYMEEDKMYARHDEANVDDFLDNHSN